MKISPSGAQTTLGSGLSLAYAVAVDTAGDVFIADYGNHRVVEVPANGGAQITVNSGGPNGPTNVAVDQAGDVFVVYLNSPHVVEIPPAGSPVSLLGSGLNYPAGVAVDGVGDLFISDSGNNRVVELWSAGQTTVASGLNGPAALAVDAAGDLFVVNDGNHVVVEIPANGGAQTTVGSQLYQPGGVAVDTAGDVFIADTLNNRLVEVEHLAVNFGTVNVCPSGQTSPQPCNQTATLTYNVGSNGDIEAVNLLTAGAPNLDFTLGATNCGPVVEDGSSCTVTVTFAPRAPGVRIGAVQLVNFYNGQQILLASTPIYGQGQGPAIAFGPGAQTTVPTSALGLPWGTAVDGAGDIFVADNVNNQVLEVRAAGGSPITVLSGLNNPEGLAVDGMGDLFIADSGNSQVVEVQAGTGISTTVATGFTPGALAVDGVGDIFVADDTNNRIVEILALGGEQITLGSGLNRPMGVAVDGAGDLFISDSGNNRVVEIPTGGAQTTLYSDLLSPYSLAVDAAGDLFIADSGNSRVLELPAGGAAPITVAVPTYGVALDAAGDLFIGNLASKTVVEIQRSLAPSFSFPSTTVGSTTNPQSLTIQNIGNQPLNAVAPGLSISTNFEQQAGSGTPADCTTSFSLTPGASCNLSIAFAPQSAGNLQGTAVLTDNALNAPTATQAINLSGTGTNTAPQASLSTSVIAFGNQAVGSASAAQTVTLSNTGQTALSIASISVSGNFAETNNCGASLAQGTSCQISVTFMPQSTGTVTGMVTITDNNNKTAGSIQTVSLTGTGTPSPYDSAITVTLSSTNLVYPGATNVVVSVAGSGGKTATGSVTIYDGTSALYTLTLGGDGKAYWYISPGLNAGTHSISASYTGDPNNPAGQSAPVTVTVSPVPVNLSVSCWNASFPYGGNESCSVSASSNAGSALGAITYTFDNNAPVSVPLSNGTTQFTISTPATGSHTIVISYAQQGNFAASGPNTQMFTVNPGADADSAYALQLLLSGRFFPHAFGHFDELERRAAHFWCGDLSGQRHGHRYG